MHSFVKILEEDCIPVGCVPLACWPYPSMHCAGGVCPRGVSAKGEGCVCRGGMADTPREQNDRCKNTIFVAGGKDVRDISARFTSKFFIYLTDMNDPGCESSSTVNYLSELELFVLNERDFLSLIFSLFCANVQLKFATVHLLATMQFIFLLTVHLIFIRNWKHVYY